MNRISELFLRNLSRPGSYLFTRRPSLPRWTLIPALLLSSIFLSTGRADTFGDFTYTNIAISATVTITGYTGPGGDITIPDVIAGKKVTTIGDLAFYNCSVLTNVSVSTNVTTIGVQAFYGCNGLTNFTIPARLTRIDAQALAACNRLLTITVDALNPSFSSVDGVLFNTYQFQLIQCPGGKVGEYVVPDKVSVVQPAAFSGCRGLQSITTRTIGMFAKFASVDGVLFNNSKTLLLAFPGGRTGSYTIPRRVSAVESFAFSGCSGLTNITLSEAMTSIRPDVFQDCTGLTRVVIVKSVASVADSAFDGCTNLTGLYFAGNPPKLFTSSAFLKVPAFLTVYYRPGTTGWTSTFAGLNTAVWFDPNVQDFVYRQNGSTITITGYTGPGGAVTIPDTIFDEAVNSLTESAFASLTNLTSVSIPGSVTNIGALAFADCPNLTNVTFTGNAPTPVPADLFSNASNVTVYYRAGSTGWGDTYAGRPTAVWVDPNAQDYTYQQTGSTITITKYTGSASSVVIPDTIFGFPVTVIGDYAFYKLTNLTEVVVPNTVSRLGWYSFAYCTNMTNVAIGDHVANIDDNAFAGCLRLPSVVIPNSVTNIGMWTFQSCTALTNINIPKSVTSIGAWAFKNCVSLANINIANSVLAIGIHAFEGCIGLKTIVVPASVNQIGFGAFGRCVGLTNVVIQEGVCSIDGSVFLGCTGLINIGIPNSVTNIDGTAFQECSGLVNIEVGHENPIFSSSDGVLFNKSQTTLLHLPSGRTGSYAVPGGVTNIGDHAFAYRAGLTNVTFSETVNSIGIWSFTYCTNLTSISVDPLNTAFKSLDGVLYDINQTSLIQCPAGRSGSYAVSNGITTIGSYAFYGCAGLTNIVLPDSLTTIGAVSFYGCPSLSKITIPANVASLGVFAFNNCGALTKMFFEGNAPSEQQLFNESPNVTVFYRAGTTGWGTTFSGRPTALWEETPYQEWARNSGLLDQFPNASGESDDPDHDGMTNLQEMLAGTDPANPASKLAFERIPRTNDLEAADKTDIRADQHALYIQTVPGIKYEIQSAGALGGTWQTETNITATTTQKRILVNKPLDKGFYRILLVP